MVANEIVVRAVVNSPELRIVQAGGSGNHALTPRFSDMQDVYV
jgi:hypothetical protein